MAGTRKLLSEIDRTLKKVNEGIEVFDQIWEKVYAASQQNQKEKYESDLKKEIKKLQRFRDQLKSWIGNSDVKDKIPLIESRKLIEQKMEQFKICERQTKTKAYSKEGLAQRERLDPNEKAKQNSRLWIQECLCQFNSQIETLESDLERLNKAKGKRQNKNDIAQLKDLVVRHNWHIQKLEQITRLLDNDALSPLQVDTIRDDIEYYLEANQEPDFMDTYGEGDVYESLELDSVGVRLGGVDTDRDPFISVSNTTVDGLHEPGLSDCQNMSTNWCADPLKRVECKTPMLSLAHPPSSDSCSNSQEFNGADTEDQSPHGQMDDSLKNKAEIFVEQVHNKTDHITNTGQIPVHRRESSRHESGSDISQALHDKQRFGLFGDQKQVLHMLEASLPYIPETRDSEKSKSYIPRNPYPTPSSFPNSPAPLFESASVYEKFDVDTLFFVFYYQQGTYQQYLAARELKKQTWAYHKKYMTWFKRHEEPKVTCEEFEQGTYVYFDYETGWCQRIKSEFTFEYSYLEDELAV